MEQEIPTKSLSCEEVTVDDIRRYFVPTRDFDDHSDERSTVSGSDPRDPENVSPFVDELADETFDLMLMSINAEIERAIEAPEEWVVRENNKAVHYGTDFESWVAPVIDIIRDDPVIGDNNDVEFMARSLVSAALVSTGKPYHEERLCTRYYGQTRTVD